MAVLFAAGILGVSNTAYAAERIGVVDLGFLIEQHPDTQAARESIKTETEKVQKEFDEKSQTLNTIPQKEELRKQLQQQLDVTKQALLEKVKEKITAAVKEVADAKGITLVVDKGIPIYGGQDITSDVGRKILGK